MKVRLDAYSHKEWDADWDERLRMQRETGVTNVEPTRAEQVFTEAYDLVRALYVDAGPEFVGGFDADKPTPVAYAKGLLYEPGPGRLYTATRAAGVEFAGQDEGPIEVVDNLAEGVAEQIVGVLAVSHLRPWIEGRVADPRALRGSFPEADALNVFTVMHLGDAYVLPGVRGRGVGQALYGRAMEDVQARIDVGPPNEPEAITAYLHPGSDNYEWMLAKAEAMGFKLVGEVCRLARGLQFMAKRLRDANW